MSAENNIYPDGFSVVRAPEVTILQGDGTYPAIEIVHEGPVIGGTMHYDSAEKVPADLEGAVAVNLRISPDTDGDTVLA